ncbi:hypothetical protein [Neotabrizicola sp. VNH66]|uniref:hypothetical protein n=1 Tax=Neotabrizicola sp. VNH66 TaxID=3400918 RepID=UPI003C097252
MFHRNGRMGRGLAALILMLCLWLPGQAVQARETAVADEVVLGLVQVLLESPDCKADRGRIGQALKRYPEEAVEAAIAFLRNRDIGAGRNGSIALTKGLCPAREPELALTVLTLVQLHSCAVTPARLWPWLREAGIAPAEAALALAQLAGSGEISVRGADQFIATGGANPAACSDEVAEAVAAEVSVLKSVTQEHCLYTLDTVERHLARRAAGSVYADAVLAALREEGGANHGYEVNLAEQLVMVGSEICRAAGAEVSPWGAEGSPRARLVGALRGAGCAMPGTAAARGEMAEAAGLGHEVDLVEALLMAGAAGDLDAAAGEGELRLTAAACGTPAAEAAAGGGREAALALFREAEGCALDTAALEAGLGGTAEAVMGAMIAAGEVSLSGGRLVLEDGLCRPAPEPDPVRAREEAIDAFAAKACSMTPGEAETVLGPAGRAALDGMIATGEVKLVFGRLAMEVAVCQGLVEAPPAAEPVPADIPEVEAAAEAEVAAEAEAPAAAPAPPAAVQALTPEAAAGRLAALSETAAAAALVAALEANGCAVDLDDKSSFQARILPAFAEAAGIPGALVLDPQVRAALEAAVRLAAAEVERTGEVFYSSATGWYGLASCKDRRADISVGEAKVFLEGMDDAEADNYFALIVEAQGCILDFTDGDALSARLIDGYLGAMGHAGTGDKALRDLAERLVAEALERAASGLERVGNSSRFRLKGCTA